MGKAKRIRAQRKAGTRKPNERSASDYSPLWESKGIDKNGQPHTPTLVGYVNKEGTLVKPNHRLSDTAVKSEVGGIVNRIKPSKGHLRRMMAVINLGYEQKQPQEENSDERRAASGER